MTCEPNFPVYVGFFTFLLLLNLLESLSEVLLHLFFYVENQGEMRASPA